MYGLMGRGLGCGSIISGSKGDEYLGVVGFYRLGV